MKLLLFNSAQNSSFKFLKKININNDEEVKLLDINPDVSKDIDELIDYFEQKIGMNSMSEIDLSLFKMLSYEIQSHINQN